MIRLFFACAILFVTNFASAAIKYRCNLVKDVRISFEVFASDRPMRAWQVGSGWDGTNPFSCFFPNVNSKGQAVFLCESYQGAAYGYLTLPKELKKWISINLSYVDENDLSIIRSLDGICKQVHELPSKE